MATTLQKARITLRELRRTIQLVWISSKAWTLASIVLLLIQSVFPILTLFLMKLVIDAFAKNLTTPNLDSTKLFEYVLPIILATGGFTILTAVVRLAATYVNTTQIQLVTLYVFDRLHSKSVVMDIEYYENPNYHDTLHRAMAQASSRPPRIVNNLLRITQSSLSLLTIVGLLVTFNWAMTVILFLAALPGLVIRLRTSRQMHDWQKKNAMNERRANYLNLMLTSPAFAKEIRLFGLGRLIKERFHTLREHLDSEQRRISLYQSLADLLIQVSATAAVIAAYAYMAYQTTLRAITLGDLVMYYQAFQRGQGFLQDVISGVTNLYEDMLFVSSLFEFLDLEPKMASPAQPRAIPRPMQEGIRLENVKFQYPHSPRPTLNGVNLELKPGQIIALVGANGAGKTTLIKLLCRLYDPTQGRITLDGVDLRDFEVADWRRQIGVVFQDYMSYLFTAAENIWFGNVDAPLDIARIEYAADQAGVGPKIRSLKHGFQTNLGRYFEDGEELSIGEWQKVALARAFMREAQIVILDEPSSSMDAEAEYEIFSQFRKLMAGKTAILISHRLSTVRMADLIYVLEQGVITETGTHDELMKHQARYAYLFETQAQYYTPSADD